MRPRPLRRSALEQTRLPWGSLASRARPGKLLGATVSLVVTTDQTLSTRARQGRWWSENAATSSVTVMVPGAPSLEVRSRQQFGVGTSAPPEALGRNFLLLDAPNPHVGPVEHATTTTTSGAITTDALGQYLTGSVSATVDATSGVRLVTAHAEATSSTSTSTSLCVAYRYLPILSVTAGPPTGAMLVTGISTVGFSGWLLRSRRRSRMHR